MKQFKHSTHWKQWLAAAAAVSLLFAAGCSSGAGKAAKDSTAAPGTTEVTTAEPIDTSRAAEETTLPVETVDEPEETSKFVAGVISVSSERLNRFLTGFVQQEVLNTQTDRDEDAELVRFAFRYLQYNDPGSVTEQEGDHPCRILTLEKVNETLNRLLGRTITPDREDYSILSDESEEFHCSFRDGSFLHTPPYHTDEYGYPVRFALVETVDEETCTVHFRLYRANVSAWEVGEADRHIPLLPAMSFLDAEGANSATKNWIIRIGEGDATFRDFSKNLQLDEFSAELYH
jgi:hypothetical protein